MKNWRETFHFIWIITHTLLFIVLMVNMTMIHYDYNNYCCFILFWLLYYVLVRVYWYHFIVKPLTNGSLNLLKTREPLAYSKHASLSTCSLIVLISSIVVCLLCAIGGVVLLNSVQRRDPQASLSICYFLIAVSIFGTIIYSHRLYYAIQTRRENKQEEAYMIWSISIIKQWR